MSPDTATAYLEMSNPAVRNRFVSGPFGEVGYIMKKPGHGFTLQQALEERTQRKQDEMSRRVEIDRMKHEECMKKFWVAADLHSLNSRISRFVDLGMQAHDKDLELKKNKLKVLMLDEQSELTREYTDKAQKSADQVFESKRKKAEEIQRTAQDAQRSFVEKAYERIFKQNCDELRTRVQRESRVALNEIHKMQMCEKLLAEDLEKEDEKIWSALANEEDERRKRRSEQERASLDHFAKDYISGLEQQMRDTDYRKRNEECVERLEEGWRREIQEKKEHEYDTREAEAKHREEQTSRDIIQQLEINKLIRDRQKQEEEYLDKLMIDADLEAYRAELAAVVDNRDQLRSELAIFRESLKQYNDAVEAHEKDLEVVSEMDKRRIEAKKKEALIKVATARRDLLASCVEVRKQQVADRKAREEKLKNEDLDCSELLKHRLAQNEELDAAPKYPGQVWGKPEQFAFAQASKMNAEQEKYLQVLRQRAQLEVQEMVKNRKKEEEDTERKIGELLRAPVQEVAGTGVHPFLPSLMAAKK